MKVTKTIIAVIAALALVTGVVGVKSAMAVLTQVGIVEGVISGPDDNAVVGANITVVCHNAGGDQTKNTTTDGDGFYIVEYTNYQCVAGDKVNVTASKDGQSGTREGEMEDEGTVGRVHLDVAIINIPMVPEFGLITGGLALMTSAGSLFFLRRRVV